jgi:hypothetical protein
MAVAAAAAAAAVASFYCISVILQLHGGGAGARLQCVDFHTLIRSTKYGCIE